MAKFEIVELPQTGRQGLLPFSDGRSHQGLRTFTLTTGMLPRGRRNMRTVRRVCRSRGDASELLESGEEAVDDIAIAILVLVLVKWPLLLAVCLGRSERFSVFAADAIEQCVGVKGLVRPTASGWLGSSRSCAWATSRTCPPVRMNRASCPSPSAQIWIWVVNPPREQPRPCSIFLGSAGSMLVGTRDGAIQKDVFKVGILRERGKDGLPHRLVCPAGEAAKHAVPETTLRRPFAPWTADARRPQHGFDE